MTYTLRKHERLCAGRLIDQLHTTGHRLSVYPLAVRWQLCQPHTLEATAQVMFVAPKRKLHHAVDRNRAKRLMRECYRLRKPDLYAYLDSQGLQLALALSYMHHQPLPYHTLSHKFDKMIEQLKTDIAAQCNA